MRKTLAVSALLLALAACDTFPGYEPGRPGPSPVFPSGVTYRAIGTEPFWNLDLGRDMTFVDRGTDLTIIQPLPTPQRGVAGETYRTPRISANIVHAPCSDGMSDRTYPDRVDVTVDGRAYRGCGAAADWSGWRGEGQAPADAAPALAGTRWRVTSVNARPVPVGDYHLTFGADGRLGARFGCNSMGAGYRQDGATLTVGALMATRMACPNMGFEDQGAAILGQPLTISGAGPRLTLTSSAGTIDLARQP